MSKYYVFPVGMIEVKVITKDEFDRIIKEGKAKGHTHVQIMYVGYCDRFLSMESAALENISNNLEGYGVYAVKTGFPVYSNCNRFRYDPYISGVTQKKNNSYGSGLISFINN